MPTRLMPMMRSTVSLARMIYTMRRNLQDALELYCEGDTAGVMEQELMANLHLLNALYENIAALFEHEGIERFCRLPKDSAAQQKFRKPLLRNNNLHLLFGSKR